MIKKNHYSYVASIGICILIIGIYFISWFDLSLNIPIGDDFPAYVELTSKYSAGKLMFSDFFVQINEHRIFYNRAWWIINLGLTNFVNFKFLLFIGNLSLVFLLLFYYKIIADLKLSIWLLPAIAFVLFSWVGYSNSLCSMMALSNYTYPLLTCIGFYLLVNGTSNNQYIIGNLSLLLAFYTSGIGFIAMAIGVAVLFYRKLYRPAFISLLVSVVFIGIYFAFYQSSPVQSDVLVGISHPIELSIRYFAFLGGILNISFLSPIPEVVLGIVLLSAFLYSFIKLKHKIPLDLLIITLFFLFLGGIVVVARFELNEYIANRFKINSAIIFICITILFWKALPANKIRTMFTIGLLGFTSVLNLFNYKSYNDYKFWVDEFAIDLLNVQYGIETTALQPKGQVYIQRTFYQADFQKSYRGLNVLNISNSVFPVELISDSNQDFKIRFTSAQMNKMHRPILCIKDQSSQIVGYIPLHYSNKVGEEWSFKDAANITSALGVSAFIADLKP